MTNTAPESSPKPSKKRRRWIRVLGVVVILAVLVALLAPLLLSTGWARSKVEVAMADALNTEVAVDGFGFGWFRSASQALSVFGMSSTPLRMIVMPTVDCALTGNAAAA